MYFVIVMTSLFRDKTQKTILRRWNEIHDAVNVRLPVESVGYGIWQEQTTRVKKSSREEQFTEGAFKTVKSWQYKKCLSWVVNQSAACESSSSMHSSAAEIHLLHVYPIFQVCAQMTLWRSRFLILALHSTTERVIHTMSSMRTIETHSIIL